MELLTKELNQLVFDYEKCPNESIKKQILQDINLLREALALLTDEKETKNL
ncbi:hypothetical protein MKY37_20850 [Psychrobacillus sp. FSL K6-2836]|uniref:hypothetical protein n=1 Tax=Psychrobacillus sp. FSL K6-2836 TaxID=2921548 RepID=UPI0030F70503